MTGRVQNLVWKWLWPLMLVFVAANAWMGRWIQDDAYISFRYARNAARGLGFVWQAGDRVEGYSNFLWTAIASIPLRMGGADPMPWMQGLGVLLLILSLELTRRIALGARGAVPAQFAEATVFALIPLTSYSLWFVGGMETGLISFLNLAWIGVATMARPSLRLGWLGLGGVAVALLLTRMDQIFGVVAVGAYWTIYHRRQLRAGSLFWIALPALGVYFPYLVWKVRFYGELFPNPYYAKLAYLTYYSRGWQQVSLFLTQAGFWVLLAIMTIAWKSSGSRLRLLMGSSLVLFFANALYLTRLGGDFMEWRFLLPSFAPFLVAAVLAGVTWISQLRVRSTRLLNALRSFFLLLAIGGVYQRAPVLLSGERPPYQDTIARLGYLSGPPYCWREIGMKLRQWLPSQTVVGTTAAGMIPYFYDGPVVDLHGLNHRAISRTAPQDRGRVGHEIELVDPSRIRELGVKALVRWPYLELKPNRPESDLQGQAGKVTFIPVECQGVRWLGVELL